MKVKEVVINAPANTNATYILERSTEKVWIQIDYASVANSNSEFSVQTSVNGTTWGEILNVYLPDGTSGNNAITMSIDVPGKLQLRLVYSRTTTDAGTYTIRTLS